MKNKIQYHRPHGIHCTLTNHCSLFQSPHKFRHGNAVYSLKQASTVADLKAISMNMVQADLKVTDGIYGVLSDLNVKETIQNLGIFKKENSVIPISEEILKELKSNYH